MKIEARIVGDVAAMMARAYEAGQRATSAGIRAGTEGLKTDWRAQVTGAGLGQRLANTVRSRTYPGRPSMNAAGLVWSNAPRILDAFERGGTFRSLRGRYLVIPTAAAPRGPRNRRLTPEDFERRTGQKLRLIPRRGQPSLLVAEGRISARGRYAVSRSKTGRGLTTVVMFLLVPTVTLRKRLDLARAAEAQAARIPAAITGAWRGMD